MQKYQTIVTAKYEGEIGERREQRILNALEHCGVRVPYHEVLTREQTAAGEMSFTSGDVEWSEEEDEDGYRGELKNLCRSARARGALGFGVAGPVASCLGWESNRGGNV
jgi:hypothetical protein